MAQIIQRLPPYYKQESNRFYRHLTFHHKVCIEMRSKDNGDKQVLTRIIHGRCQMAAYTLLMPGRHVTMIMLRGIWSHLQGLAYSRYPTLRLLGLGHKVSMLYIPAYLKQNNHSCHVAGLGLFTSRVSSSSCRTHYWRALCGPSSPTSPLTWTPLRTGLPPKGGKKHQIIKMKKR